MIDRKSAQRMVLAVMAGVILMAGLVEAKNIFQWRSIIWTGGRVCGGSANDSLRSVMKTASGLGYNEILWDTRFLNLSPKCKDALRELLAYAKGLGIHITPASQGQTTPYADDRAKDQGEAFANKGTPFVVSEGKARVAVGQEIPITNPGFESGLTGWRTSYANYFSIDSTVKYSGTASLRCKDPVMGGHMRMSQMTGAVLKPHRTYELSMYVKSTPIEFASPKGGSFPNLKSAGFAVMGGGRYLYNLREKQGVKPNMDWKQITARFNTLGNTRITIMIQAFLEKHSAFRGTVWYDDVRIREIGLADVVRRASLPVVVKAAGNTILTEGRDYVVGDQELTIPAGSSVKEGDVLTVDWFRPAIVSFNSPEIAFCNQQVWDIVRDQIRVQDEWFGSSLTGHMKYGEWKAPGWDPACIQRYNVEKAGAGPYIGSVARITEQLFREANCNRVVSSWNDMFDPYHNSLPHYHTSNGGTARSGFELSSTHVIRNWNNGARANGDASRIQAAKRSILYFAGPDTTKFFDPVTNQWRRKTTQQRQILLAGFFGGWKVLLPALDEAEIENGLPDGAVIGMSYMSFKGPTSYGNIEAMKTACEAAGRWSSGPVPLPTPAPGCGATDPALGIGTQSERTMKPKLTLTAMSNGAIRFTLKQHADVRLQLVDVQGRVVKTLVDKRQTAGSYQVALSEAWVASGVYFVNLSVDNGSAKVTKKVALF